MEKKEKMSSHCDGGTGMRCLNCGCEISEECEYWFEKEVMKFCSVDCIAEYFGISIEEVEDAIWDNEDKEESI